MPPGYGYLTRHLDTGRLMLGEAVQIINRRVLALKMRKKHGSVPKLHTCSGPESRNEQKTPAFEVPLHTELRFRPHGHEQPHKIGEPAERSRADGWPAAARSGDSDNYPRPER
jgi:hypothetical protein